MSLSLVDSPAGVPRASIVPAEPVLSPEALRGALRMTEASESLHNLCARLKDERHFEAALVAARRAIAMAPRCGAHYNALGSTLWCLGRFDEALDALLSAAELAPDDVGPMSNLAGCYASLGRYGLADSWFRRALERNPAHLHVRYDLAMAYLDQGRWAEGFREYEVRFDFRGEALYPRMPYAKWQGEDLDGKTLYVQFEQGSGDRILCSRYLAVIHRTWPTCRILAICGNELVSLLWGFSDFVTFLPSGIPWPAGVDYGVYLMSLPGIFATTPEHIPLDPGLILSRVAGLKDSVRLSEVDGRLRVGVAWTGNPEMLRNAERSIPFELMLGLEELPGVQLYSLQVGHGSQDIVRFGAGQLIEDLGPMLAQHGYVAAAATMLNLDLVITACTSTAHLAGALGVPTWVLLCRDPYWVWLRGREDSPWYPSARLFRQTRQGEWRPVIDQVKRELGDLVERRSSSLPKEAHSG